MGTIMNFSTNGSENPTKAVLPFLSANGAVEAGISPRTLSSVIQLS